MLQLPSPPLQVLELACVGTETPSAAVAAKHRQAVRRRVIEAGIRSLRMMHSPRGPDPVNQIIAAWLRFCGLRRLGHSPKANSPIVEGSGTSAPNDDPGMGVAP